MARLDMEKEKKWILTIDLSNENIEKVVSYAELLQYNEVEGLDTSDIDTEIKELLEANQ